MLVMRSTISNEASYIATLVRESCSIPSRQVLLRAIFVGRDDAQTLCHIAFDGSTFVGCGGGA